MRQRFLVHLNFKDFLSTLCLSYFEGTPVLDFLILL